MNPFSYNTYYIQGMLAVTLVAALLYVTGHSKRAAQEGFNAAGMLILTGAMILFFGTRPISGAFVDMVTYSQRYDQAAAGIDVFPSDPGFSWLMQAMAPNFTVGVFFLTCAILYVLPLTLAAYFVHGRWAFPVVVSILGSFSFFSYGVNGIRNGIAASLAILAFAFHRHWALTYPLSILAGMMHQAIFITVAFFAATRWVRWVPLYAATWAICLLASIVMGAETAAILTRIFPDNEGRLETYLLGTGLDRGGFRLDFILYSIVPVIISHLFASKEGRQGVTYRRLLCTYLATNAFWLLSMYAAYSNRFAYLSWCILPWVIICPHLPDTGEEAASARNAPPKSMPLLAAALAAHFAFTYFMFMVYYG